MASTASAITSAATRAARHAIVAFGGSRDASIEIQAKG
jgi:hypothetical protein